MTENKTLQEFIDEKKQNFCNYLLQRFPKSVNTIDFMVYIKENIRIFETDLPKFVDNKFSEYFVEEGEKLDKETHEKLVRYLQMFIDFCRN